MKKEEGNRDMSLSVLKERLDKLEEALINQAHMIINLTCDMNALTARLDSK